MRIGLLMLDPNPGFLPPYLQQACGWLLLLGTGLLLAIFLVPLALPEPVGWEAVERRVAISDWLFSVAFVLLGLGFLLLEAEMFHYQIALPLRYRIGLSVLCFGIAGRRTIFAKH